jgi:hypothetical protein
MALVLFGSRWPGREAEAVAACEDVGHPAAREAVDLLRVHLEAVRPRVDRLLAELEGLVGVLGR